MMLGVRDTAKHKRIFVLLVIASFTLVLIPHHAEGQSGGIGVSNDPPSWVDIYIHDHNGAIAVYVSLKDLNGWNDIYNVTLVVLGGNGDEICNITYKQYTDLDATIAVIDWVETTGNYLIEDDSGYEPVDIYPWNPDNAVDSIGLNVTFSLTPFSGETIRITAYDMQEAKCGYEGPFSADYEIPPYLKDDVVVPISISAAVAFVGALIITIRRRYSNKLARIIEGSEKK
ncbi:MAG: hypothetical protein KAS67_01765 [Thermoplasmata archaeon]|nr:hypothetical protein [Thermoplasmata archaeon]